MTALQEELLTAEAPEDLTQLIKEYARASYKALHGRAGEEFEELWSQVYDPDLTKRSPEIMRLFSTPLPSARPRPRVRCRHNHSHSGREQARGCDLRQALRQALKGGAAEAIVPPPT